MKKIVMMLVLALCWAAPHHAEAAQVKLGWVHSSTPDVVGYNIYYGTESGVYGTPIDAGYVNEYTVTGLLNNTVYFFTVTAYDSEDHESSQSSEVYINSTDESLWRNYIATVVLESRDDDAMGFTFRMIDNSNYYRFSWNRQLPYRRLEKCVNGVFTLLAQDSVVYNPRQTYVVESILIGNKITIRVDGVAVFGTVTDNSHQSGTVALYCWGNQNTSFHSVTVRDYNSGKALLKEEFNDNLNNWVVIDQGTKLFPSIWEVSGSAVIQKSNICSGQADMTLPKLGTYLKYVPLKNFVFSFRMNSGDNDELGVMFRYSRAEKSYQQDSFYRFSWNAALGLMRLTLCQNGVFSDLVHVASAYVVNRDYQIQISVQDDNVQVRVDGQLVINIYDNTLEEGTVAFYCWGNTNSRYDDVQLTDTATGTVILSEDFNAISAIPTYFQIVDEGNQGGCSVWRIDTILHLLVQRSNIASPGVPASYIPKKGTFLYYKKGYVDF